MIIVCQKCKTRYNLDDNVTKESSFIARCSKCNHVFSAYRPARIEEISFIDLAAAKKRRDNGNIISISNRKGGVAKTSTCLNLGLSLSLHKNRVLVIDFDVQSNLTISLGYQNTNSFYDVLDPGKKGLSEIIIKTRYPNLWLLPSNKNMVLLNKKYFGAKNFEFILNDRLNAIKDKYDYILIDTPPSIEFFTLNALTSSNMVIIPSQCDYLSTHGVNQILRLIKLVKEKTNPDIESRILITMFDKASTASRLICTKLKNIYEGITFDTIIEMDDKIKEAQIMSMPVIHYNRQSRSGLQYLNLAKEILGSPGNNGE